MRKNLCYPARHLRTAIILPLCRRSEALNRKLIYQENSAIAPRAWLAELQAGPSEVRVLHGRSVEARPDRFVEGVWAGDFSTGDFIDTVSFASGGVLEPERVVFSPPDHTLSPLFLRRQSGEVMVANSLGLLLAHSGDRIIPDHEGYFRLMEQIADGIEQGPLPLPVKGGVYEMHYWQPFQIGPDLEYRRLAKRRQVPLSTYQEYIGHLSSSLAAIIHNADDPGRRRRYSAITPLSSGYDSTAIAVLAAQLGQREAVSFTQSRPREGASLPDDGEEAAQALGISLRKADRLAYSRLPPPQMPEIETMGAGSEFSSIRPDIAERMMLAGFMGDTMWERVLNSTSTDIGWRATGGTYAGHNCLELLLWNDTILIPVPFIAAEQQPEIHRISNLPEMAPWTLNNGYDRPICRRLGEEAGIPRTAFGQKKKAAGVFHRDEGLRETMTEQSYADYMAWVARHGQRLTPWRIRLKATQSWAWRANWALRKRMFRKTERWFGRGFSIPVVVPHCSLVSKSSLLFPWAAERITERYAAVISPPAVPRT